MTLPKSKRISQRAMVLPSLIMLSLILIGLSAVLLSSGTSTLRKVTHHQSAEQAYRVAEAGLAHAVERYIKTDAGDDAEDEVKYYLYEGTLATEEMRYSVKVTRNSLADEEIEAENGVRVPPGATYFLATGIAADQTSRKTGALFLRGSSSFRAGVLANNLVVTGSEFSAYDSRENVEPVARPDEALLTSNGSVDLDPLARQFRLEKSRVKGRIYTAKGTLPEDQIAKTDTVVEGEEKALQRDIKVPKIEVPDLGQSLWEDWEWDEWEEAGEDEEIVQFNSVAVGLSGLSVSFRRVGDKYEWKRDGTEYWYESQDGDEAIPGGGYGTMLRRTGTTYEYSETTDGPHWVDWKTAVDLGSGTVTTVPTVVTNPTTLTTGAYRKVLIEGGHKVTIGSGEESALASGTVFVIEELEILDTGTLVLPEGSDQVSIYVTKRLKIDGQNAIANDTRKPPNLKVYYTGEAPIELAGGSKAYFTLVAPEAEVNLAGPDPSSVTPTTNFYGALVGKKVSVSRANVFFDIATGGIGEGSDLNSFVCASKHRL